MGTMLKEFDEAFDGNTGGDKNDSNDRSNACSQFYCLDHALEQGQVAEERQLKIEAWARTE